MNIPKSKLSIVSAAFGLLMIGSCGKDYTCKCTAVTKMNPASGVADSEIESSFTDKFSKRETARLMCENLKEFESSPSMTMQSTCVLK